MGVDRVAGAKGTDVTLRGNNGTKLSKEEAKVAELLAGLDGKAGLSKSDLKKLQKMKPADQIKYINSALKNSGYKVANVYDSEDGTTSPGVNWTSNGVYINFSKGGKTISTDIMGNAPGKNGHLGITYKK